MRKPDKVYKIYSCVFGLLLLLLAGCSKESDAPSDMQPVQEAEDNMQTEDAATEELASEEIPQELALLPAVRPVLPLRSFLL